MYLLPIKKNKKNGENKMGKKPTKEPKAAADTKAIKYSLITF